MDRAAPADSGQARGPAISRDRLLIFICVGLVLIGCVLAVRVWPPALSAAAACRHLMEHTEGYGWHIQAARPVAQTAASDAVVTYFDGFNSASCHVHQYGPLWIVVGVGQTMIGCNRGLSAAGEETCPRGTYGVIP
jgi:hypothetical protein